MGLALAVLVVAGACGTEAPTPAPSPTATPAHAQEDETVALTLRAVLASSDLSVGDNRVVFALVGTETSAPVRTSAVNMDLAYVKGDTLVPQENVQAVFRQWPSGPGGVFTAQVDFEQAGTWVAELSPEDGEAEGELARMVMDVKEESATPAIGATAPRTKNRTVDDVGSLAELTTDAEPDPELYDLTIADALEERKPLLVTFATPAFCSSATCGPQVDVVKALKERYEGQANFIHVEIYANPVDMQGDPSKGVVADAVQEWGLPSEPWTFVVDPGGDVAAKFEGFASREELEEALTGFLLID